MSSDTAVNELDLFSDATLESPYEAYRVLRDAGPAVRLDGIGAWAVPRYESAREVLGDWERFSAAQGVGLNDDVNQATVGTILASDPPLHDTLRGVLAERLSPRAIRSLRDGIQQQAERLVTPLVDAGSFDAVTQLGQIFPPSIVADLIGIPEEIRPNLLPWGDAMFNSLGPANDRMLASLPALQAMFGWVHTVDPLELTEGSMGRAVFEAADAGIIDRASAPQLLAAYLAAAMDTTVNAIGAAIWLFSTHPEQWEALRADRSLIPAAFNEILRYESPVYLFTRVTTSAIDLHGTEIPAGERLIVLYGSANRDERHYGADADRFDITRDSSDHLAFGYGVHGCAGQGFARMEAHALFDALADRVERFVPAAPAIRHINNTVRGLESVPVDVVRAR